MEKKNIIEFSFRELYKPAKLVNQRVRINGLVADIARPAGSKKFPSKFKSLF